MNNQIQSIEIPEKGLITYNQYLWTMPKTVTLPGGSKKEFEYDALMQVKRITALDPGSNVIMDLNYTRDKVGNILSKESLRGAEGDVATSSYTYDKTYQLLKTVYPESKVEEFIYDKAGNRESMSLRGAEGDAAISSYSHNANNETLSVIPAQAGIQASFEFDSNGNMIKQTNVISNEERNLIYNVENRLSSVIIEKADTGELISETSYYYDPFGRRLKKTVIASGDEAISTYFFYSDEGLTAEITVPSDVIPNLIGNPEAIKTYGYQPASRKKEGVFWMANPIFIKNVHNTYFYQNNHLYVPQKIISSNGEVAWSAESESFGSTSITVNTIENNLRFPGQYFDAETGEHYNWNRFYIPKLGRYNRIDPLGFDGHDTNLYRYVKNGNINTHDSIGFFPSSAPIYPSIVPINICPPVHHSDDESPETTFNSILKFSQWILCVFISEKFCPKPKGPNPPPPKKCQEECVEKQPENPLRNKFKIRRYSFEEYLNSTINGRLPF